MRKKSDVDILIEQCIQDANCEYLEEGFMDNIKAGLNGAKEWLKADARNSFKLRNKNDVKNDRRWSQRKGKVSSYAKSIANTLQDYKKSGGTLGRGMKVDDVISRLNQVAQGKYPRGNAQTSAQTQQTAEQPQQTPAQTPIAQQSQSQQQTAPQAKTKQSSNQQQTQPAQKTQQTPTEKTAQTSNTTVSNNTTTNNTVAQNKMLDSIGGNVPQENTSNNNANPANNGFTPEANELLQTFGSFKSKDTETVDKLQGIYDKLSDDEKEKIKQQVNPDIINLINLQQSNAPYEQLNQTYGSLSPQDRGIFRVISGMKHSSQVNAEANSSAPSSTDTNTQTQTPDAQNQSAPDQEAKPKGDGFAKKAGKAIINGAKKMSDSVANGFKNFKDNAKARAEEKAKIKAEKKAAAANKTAAPEPVDAEIVQNPKPAEAPMTSALGPVRQQMSPGGRPMKTVKSRVVDAEPANTAQPLALPAPQEPVKKKLSPAENARMAIAKAQAATQKAKSNAPKLNIPGSGKPIKRKRIINAKQSKDIAAARKEQEDFHKSLGDMGAEWEERVNESYYGSNSSSQLRMLNSIR